MMVRDISPRRLEIESQWRQPGCGLNCREQRFILPGSMIPAGIVIHSPDDHEEYGHDIAARGLSRPVKGVIRTGDLTIDPFRCSVSALGKPIRLTPMHTSIMLALASRIDEVCSRSDLLRTVWGEEYAPEPSRIFHSHTIEHHLLRVTVGRLRAQLGVYRDMIVTVRGFGYRLLYVPPTEAQP